MRIPVGMLLSILALAFTSTVADGQVRDRGDLVAALDSAARAHVEHPMVAGVSVAVVRGEDTLLQGGYGYADLEWRDRQFKGPFKGGGGNAPQISQS